MKKFLTVLLVIAVMFTFSFSSAFAYNVKGADETTALVTEAKTALETAEANLVSVKDYYVRNYNDGDVSFAYGAVTFAVSKDAVKAIIDDVFTEISKRVNKEYGDVVAAINVGTVSGTDLADAKATVKASITNIYNAYSTPALVTALIESNEFMADAAEAQFDVDKADAIATLDKVDYSIYSTTVPDDPTYDNNTYYYSVADIAKKIVDNAKKAINDLEFDKDASATNVAAIASFSDIADNAVDVVDDKDYYVIADAKCDASVAKTAAVNGSGGTRLITAKEEGKAVKTLDEEKAYQISVIEGTLALEKAEIMKKLRAELETATENKITASITSLNKALADIEGQFAAAKEVYTARVNYMETVASVTDLASNTVIPAIENFSNQVVSPKYTSSASDLLAITEAVDDLEALAAKMNAETGLNGTPLYDADTVAKNLKADVKTAYNGGTPGALKGMLASEDLVKNEMNRVLTGNNVTLDKVVYKTVAKWDTSVFDDDIKENAEDIIAETKAAIRAAKTVADVDAAFLAGDAKFKALATTEDRDDFQDTAAFKDAQAKYEAKLEAAFTSKKADYGTTAFGKDYDCDATPDFIDNLVAEYFGTPATPANLYTAADVDAAYEKALGEITNLKTKAELQAEQKAINDAILAIKAPVTAADEATVLALIERAEDFADYVALIDAGGAYTTYDSLLTSYRDNTLMGLAEDAIKDAVKAIGTVTVDDEDAINALEAQLDAYEDAYGAACVIDPTLEKLQADLVAAKVAAVQDAIMAIDASANPLDIAAIKAAREAYDALGEVGTSQTAYHKLLSLENLMQADIIAAVESLKITTSTKAAKKSITVSWKVVGETSAVEGYEIWKSTKKNSGFKKAFTTTKLTYKNTKGIKAGTKYYYKVRAIAYTADGAKVKSDWSNKGIRTAK